MAKTFEDIIADTVNKAVNKALASYRAQICADVADVIRRELAEANAGTAEERLITVKEAARRLIVSRDVITQMVMRGDLKEVTTPNGRRKIVESSLNRFVNGKL